MKDIKFTDEYISNKGISEYINKRYNLIRGIYSINTKLLMIIFRKETVNKFRNTYFERKIIDIKTHYNTKFVVVYKVYIKFTFHILTQNNTLDTSPSILKHNTNLYLY